MQLEEEEEEESQPCCPAPPGLHTDLRLQQQEEVKGHFALSQSDGLMLLLLLLLLNPESWITATGSTLCTCTLPLLYFETLPQ